MNKLSYSIWLTKLNILQQIWMITWKQKACKEKCNPYFSIWWSHVSPTAEEQNVQAVHWSENCSFQAALKLHSSSSYSGLKCKVFILYFIQQHKGKTSLWDVNEPLYHITHTSCTALHKHCVSFVKHRNPVQMEDVQPFDFQIEATLKKQKKNDWITTRWSVLFTLQCKTVHLVYSLPIFIIFILKIAFDLRKLKL